MKILSNKIIIPNIHERVNRNIVLSHEYGIILKGEWNILSNLSYINITPSQKIFDKYFSNNEIISNVLCSVNYDGMWLFCVSGLASERRKADRELLTTWDILKTFNFSILLLKEGEDTLLVVYDNNSC
jgi:hypothetical protein